LDVNEFQPSKSHKKTLKRWNKFLNPGGNQSAIMDLSNSQDDLLAMLDITPKTQITLNRVNSPNLTDEQKLRLETILFQATEAALKELELDSLLSKHELRPQVARILHKKKKAIPGASLTSNFCLQLKPLLPASCTHMNVAQMIVAHLPVEWQARVANPGFINFRADLQPSQVVSGASDTPENHHEQGNPQPLSGNTSESADLDKLDLDSMTVHSFEVGLQNILLLLLMGCLTLG
jgi:hypothetical protein